MSILRKIRLTRPRSAATARCTSHRHGAAEADPGTVETAPTGLRMRRRINRRQFTLSGVVMATEMTVRSIGKPALGHDVWSNAPYLDSEVPALSRIRHNLVLDVEHLRYGDLPGLVAWRANVDRLRTLDGVRQLAAVNDFVNDAITYVEDRQQYGVSDYWALLSETVLRGQGDCEDIAIAKLQTLAYLGWDLSHLALLVGRLSFPNGGVITHAVGACLHDLVPPFDPVLLCNVERRLHRGSERSDFRLVYAAIAIANQPAWLVTQTHNT